MPILCACFRITEERLRGLIVDHACATVEDVSVLTGACRGCQTCRPEIEAMLRAVNGTGTGTGTGTEAAPTAGPASGTRAPADRNPPG